MKVLSGLLLAPTLAAVLLLACTPTNAARRAGGSPYDGTWSVAIYTLRGDCGSVRVAAQIVGGRVNSKDESYQANGAVGANGVIRGERCQRSAFRIWLRKAVARFRRRKLAVIQRRMLRQLVSHATRRLLLRAPRERPADEQSRVDFRTALGGFAGCDGDELKLTRVPTEWSHSLEVHL